LFQEFLAGGGFARGRRALESGVEEGFDLFSVGGAAGELGGECFGGLEGGGAV
jgi:hypothetical protein